MKRKAIVFAGSRGIGYAIFKSLSELEIDVIATSTKDFDSSNMNDVEKFIKNNPQVDILVLNTGGPPSKNFYEIELAEWEMYFNQLFLSFVRILQKVKVNDGGFIFLVSSFNIKEPNPSLVMSNSYRVALWSIMKSLTKEWAKRGVSCVNIAPGPIVTDRLISLVEDMEGFEKNLPMGKAGDANEIGSFAKAIVEHNIKYLTGVTINFDGGLSNSLF